MDTTKRRLVPYDEARYKLGGIGRTRFHTLIDSGLLVRAHLGRRAFVTSESLDALVDSLSQAGHGSR